MCVPENVCSPGFGLAYPDTDGDGVGAGTDTRCEPDPLLSGWSRMTGDCAPADTTRWQLLDGFTDGDGDGISAPAPGVCSGLTVPAPYTSSAVRGPAVGPRAVTGVAINVPDGGFGIVAPELALDEDERTAWYFGSPTRTAGQIAVTGFNLDIPAGATIHGVVVHMVRRAGPNQAVWDEEVLLQLETGVFSTNRAQPGAWPMVFTRADYGSRTDLWEAALTPSVVNGANFGVVLRVGGGAPSFRGDVDHIWIEVFHDLGPLDCQPGDGNLFNEVHGFSDGDSDSWGAGDPLVRCAGAGLPAHVAYRTTDCDDGNADVYPGQINHFTAPRPDAGFDYDCSGMEERGAVSSSADCYSEDPFTCFDGTTEELIPTEACGGSTTAFYCGGAPMCRLVPFDVPVSCR